jgi:hypothetical protein
VTIPAGGASSRGLTVVHVPRRQSRELEEGAARIDQQVDALAGGELSARPVPLQRLLAAAERHLRGSLPQLGDEAGHHLAAAGEKVALSLDLRGQHHQPEPSA